MQPGLTMEDQTANGRSDKDSMRGAGGNQSPIRELELTLDVTIELVAPVPTPHVLFDPAGAIVSTTSV